MIWKFLDNILTICFYMVDIETAILMSPGWLPGETGAGPWSVEALKFFEK